MDCSSKGGCIIMFLCFSFQNLAARPAATSDQLGISYCSKKFKCNAHVVGSNLTGYSAMINGH